MFLTIKKYIEQSEFIFNEYQKCFEYQKYFENLDY